MELCSIISIQSLKGIAKKLGSVLSERTDVRMDVLAALRKLITHCLQNGEPSSNTLKCNIKVWLLPHLSGWTPRFAIQTKISASRCFDSWYKWPIAVACWSKLCCFPKSTFNSSVIGCGTDIYTNQEGWRLSTFRHNEVCKCMECLRQANLDSKRLPNHEENEPNSR